MGGSRAFCEGDSIRGSTCNVTLHGGVRAPQKQAAPVLTAPGDCPDPGDSVVVCGCPLALCSLPLCIVLLSGVLA